MRRPPAGSDAAGPAPRPVATRWPIGAAPSASSRGPGEGSLPEPPLDEAGGADAPRRSPSSAGPAESAGLAGRDGAASEVTRPHPRGGGGPVSGAAVARPFYVVHAPPGHAPAEVLSRLPDGWLVHDPLADRLRLVPPEHARLVLHEGHPGTVRPSVVRHGRRRLRLRSAGRRGLVRLRFRGEWLDPDRLEVVRVARLRGAALAFDRGRGVTAEGFLGVILCSPADDVLHVRLHGGEALHPRAAVVVLPVDELPSRSAELLRAAVVDAEPAQTDGLGLLGQALAACVAEGRGAAVEAGLARALLGPLGPQRLVRWARAQAIPVTDDAAGVGLLGAPAPPARRDDFVFPTETALAFEAIADGRCSVALSGPPGVGKTSLVAHFAAALGLELVRVQLSTDTRAHHLLGGPEVVVDEAGRTRTAFVPSPVVRAFTCTRPTLILLDEWDLAAPGVVLGCLGGLFERDAALRLPDGSLARRGHPATRVVLASNTAGDGGRSAAEPYAGTRTQSPAVRDRVLPVRLTPPRVRDLVWACKDLRDDDRRRLNLWARLVDELAAREGVQPPSARSIGDALHFVARLAWTPARAVGALVLPRLPDATREPFAALGWVLEAGSP